ncbi:MAG: hypothetical protein V3W34_06610 [Phycisphaerae bacterium]
MSDALREKPLPVVLDREIDNEDADAFGHRHYAQGNDTGRMGVGLTFD